jgi:hypothetical protein
LLNGSRTRGTLQWMPCLQSRTILPQAVATTCQKRWRNLTHPISIEFISLWFIKEILVWIQNSTVVDIVLLDINKSCYSHVSQGTLKNRELRVTFINLCLNVRRTRVLCIWSDGFLDSREVLSEEVVDLWEVLTFIKVCHVVSTRKNDCPSVDRESQGTAVDWHLQTKRIYQNLMVILSFRCKQWVSLPLWWSTEIWLQDN